MVPGWLSLLPPYSLLLSLRNRRLLLLGSAIFIVLVAGGLLVFHTKIEHFLLTWHADTAIQGQGSIVKRFFLWESAWHMI